MKLFARLTGLMLLIASSATTAQSKLKLEIYTSAATGFSVNSVVIYGETEAILIDPQFLLSEAHRLAAQILESGKKLTTVYVSHAHPDHYFGIAVIRQAFPEARFVALPAVVEGVKQGWQARYDFWKNSYGHNLPATGPVLPEPLAGTSLTLEGETLEITGGVEGDGPDNTYIWIPSIKAVIAGDILFSNAHFVVPKDHMKWDQTIADIKSLQPEIVVPGHQTPGAPNDASVLEFMQNYLRDYDAAVASSKSAEEVQTRIKSKYPGMGLELLLNIGSQTAFPAQ
ncbi:MAG: metallo-beta-lactamase superfamily protein [Gammaproteobacteria bacterium]|nr:metallo-beta-lactamase superfamily protein [Gammaproteobacteria bacterium]